MQSCATPLNADPLYGMSMDDESRRPTLEQFRVTCLDEFAFLDSYGFQEVRESDSRNLFRIQFANQDYVVTIQGENWGLHAGVRLHDSSGHEAPPISFVPHAERGRKTAQTTGFTQLDDVKRSAEVIRTYCLSVFEGDREAFDRVAREWRRIRDPEFRRSLQKRKLP